MPRFMKHLFLMLCLALSAAASAQTYKFYHSSKVEDDARNVISTAKIDSIIMVVTPNNIKLSSGLWGTLTMSRNLLVGQNVNQDLNTTQIYCIDKVSEKNGRFKSFTYSRTTGSQLHTRNIFRVDTTDGVYFFTDGLVHMKDENGRRCILTVCPPGDDQLLKLMKSLDKSSTTQAAQPSGDVTLSGYMYNWEDYYNKGSERQNASFSFRTGNNHYIGVKFGSHVTNLSPSRQKRVRWSTRYKAIPVTLPKGVKINRDDDIVCWEQNGTSSDPNYRSVVIFIWSPASRQLQCLYTVRRNFGRTLNDYYYFRTTTDAWPGIKATLLKELPYCGTQI